jgi:hypothetical protein
MLRLDLIILIWIENSSNYFSEIIVFIHAVALFLYWKE